MLALPRADTVLRGSRALGRIAVGTVAMAALTQLIYPIAYPQLVSVTGWTGLVTVALALRNAGVVAFVIGVAWLLIRITVESRRAPAGAPSPSEES